MLDHQSSGKVSLLAAKKMMVPCLSVLLLLAVCDRSAATTPAAVQNLTATITPATNTLVLSWQDAENVIDDNLTYEIFYNVSARMVSLFMLENAISVNTTTIQDSNSPDMFAFSITNAVYFVDGVNVSVSVEAVSDSMVGPLTSTMATATGIFAPAVDSLVATPSTTVPTVTLAWTIPYTQIPPDSYSLTFNTTKLSGVPLSEDDQVMIEDFFANETDSSGGDDRMYVVGDLLFFSSYQFELTALYDEDSSAVSSAMATTLEGTPGPVRNLIVEFNETTAVFNAIAGTYTITANLTWEEPEEPNGTISTYEYSISLETDPSNIVTNGMSTVTSVQSTVTVLPDVRYRFAVTARTDGGLGESVEEIILSPEAAPSAAQNVTASPNDTHILISWSEPASPNGVVTYSVEVVERDLLTNDNFTVATENMVAGLELAVNYTEEPYSEYTVVVTSQTGAGMGDPVSVSFQTPEEAPSAPTNVAVRVIASTFAVFEWMEPEFPNGVIRRYIVSLTNSEDGSVMNVTTVPPELSVNVTGLDPFVRYWVVVFAETIDIGEGSFNFSFRTMEDIPSPVQNLTATSNATHIITMWVAPASPNGLVNYTIEIQEINLLTHEITMFETMTVSEEALILERQVRPYLMYNVSVTSQTSAGAGETVMTSFTTPEAAPSSARNLTLDFNDTAIFISWVAPAYPNGVVNYTVEVQEESLLDDTGVPAAIIASEVTADLELIVNYEVEPYSNYTVIVTSQTSAGEGMPVMESFETPEEVPSPVLDLTASFNDTHIIITWEPPSAPNGLVNYTVVVQERDLLSDDTNIPVTEVVTTELELIVEYPVEVYSEYTVNVTSQTSAGEGETETMQFQTPEEVPSPAQNVNVSSNGTHITITWYSPSQPNGIVNYTVLLQEEDLLLGTTEDITMDKVVVTELLLVVPRMTEPYREYSATVTAQTSAGRGEDAFGILTTPEDVPSAVQNLTISQQNNETLLVRWDDSASPNGNLTYIIYVTCFDLATSSLTFAEEYTVLFGEDRRILISFTDGLEPYAEYNATAVASTRAGNSSEMTDQLTTPQGESEPPRNLMTTPTNVSVTVEWEPPIDANGIIFSYLVDLFNSSDDEIDSATVDNLTTLEHTFEDLLPYTNYSVEVSALTGEVGEILGQVATDSFTTEIGIPTVPNSVTITSRIGSLIVQWDPPDLLNAPAITYTIIYSTTDSPSESNSTVTSDTIVVINDLAAFTEYSVVVQACSSVGCGSFTTPETERTQEEAPSMPRNVTAMSINSTSILIMWEPPEFLNGQLVFYVVNYTSEEPGGMPTTDSITTEDNSTSVIISSLAPFTVYNVSIVGITVEEGPPSDVVMIMTNESAPTAEPQQLMEAAVTATNITITWNPPPVGEINGIIRAYTISYFPTSNASAQPVEESVPENETSFIADGLQPFTNYTFEVRAVTISPGPPASIVVETDQAAPTAEPQQLMEAAVTATNITITWNPPPVGEINGIIRAYTISYFPTSNASAQPVEESVPENETSFIADGLQPFTNYTFEVQAVTISPGPPASIVVETDQAAPSAPLNIDAVNTSSTSVTVTWTPPLSPNGIIQQYIVTYTLTDGSSSDAEMIVVMGGATMADLTSLMIFTTYDVIVQAETVERGDPSEIVMVTTDEDLPSAPQILEAIELNSTTIRVTFDLPASPNGIITHYLVNYSISDSGEDVSMRIDAVDEQMNYTAILTNLTEFTSYRIEISAFTRIGEGNASERVVVTDPDMASPPTNLVAMAINSTAVELSWGFPLFPRGNIGGYIIYINGMFEFNLTLEVANNMSDQTFIVIMLQPFTLYTFEVAAYTFHDDEAIIGARSLDTVTTLQAAPSAPISFTLSRENQMPEQLQASWMTPDPTNGVITSYTVFCRENDTMNEFVVAQVVEDTMTMVQVTGLSAFTAYECFVTANTSVGEGDESNLDVEITNEAAPSEPPQDISGSFINSTSIQVSWAPPLESGQNGIIRNYVIRYSREDDSNVQTMNTSGLSVVITGLDEFTLYEVRVSAVTVEEGPQAVVPVRTDSDVPSQPLNLTSVNVTARSFVVTWLPPSDLNAPDINYTLQLTGPSSIVTIFDGIVPEILLLEVLDPFTQYEVVVFAVSEKGPGPSSQLLMVMTSQDTPTEPQNFTLATIPMSPQQLQASWTIPNPTNGLITNYTIQCSSPDAPSFTEVVGNVTSFVLDRLNPFTNYSCNVSATTVAGEGRSSGIVTAQTDEDEPGVPEMFMVVNVQAQQVTVSWSPPTNPNGVITGYMLNYSNSTENLSRPLGAIQQMAVIDNLNEFTLYRFELRAETSAGFGPPAVVNQTTAEAAPSAAPLNVTGVFTDSTSLRITWSPPPFPDQNGEIEAYNVTYQRTDGINFTTSTIDSFILIPGLRPFTNYSVKVAAFTVYIGPFSEPITVMTDSDTPTAPRNVTPTNITRSSITITWLAPEPTNGIIESYTIQVVRIDDSQMLPDIDVRPPDMRDYNITGLMEHVNYSIVIVASTDKGMGDGSEAIIVQTLEHHPDEPTNFNVTVINSTSMSVTWGAPADPNGVILSYHLFVTLNPSNAVYLPGNPDMNITIEDPTARIYILSGLHEFATYSLSLAAATAQGIGNRTDSVESTTAMAAPSSGVENITAPDLQSTLVTLMWTPPPIGDWNGVLTNYTISYRPVLNCSLQDQMLGFDVPSGSQFTSPSTMRDPRLAYTQSLTSALSENITIEELQEFVSYVFSVAVETSAGRSPPVDGCFMTTPTVPGVPTLQSFTTISNTSATVSWAMLPLVQHNGILDEYIVRLTNENTSMATNYTVSANELTLNISVLVPFTNYTVEVAASNQERGPGSFSTEMMTMTSEGVPSAPRNLQIVAVNTTYISLSWESPAILYASQLGPYYVTYGIANTEMSTINTSNTSIVLTGLNGNKEYIIEVRASTVAGQGNSNSTSVQTPSGPSPPVDPAENPEIVPMMQTDENGDPIGVTTNSFVVQFVITDAQEVNGDVDEYLIYVWRQPSTNQTIANYYESNLATSNFPQYASVRQKTQGSTSRKRQVGMMQTVTVGGNNDCGPTDDPCNGPLAPGSDYRVRYRLFSGDQATDYDFADQVFTTMEAPSPPSSSSSLPVIIAAVIVILVVVVIVIVVVIVVVLFMRKRKRQGDFNLKISKYKNGHNGDQKLLPRNESGSNVQFLGPGDPGIVPIHEMAEGGTPLKASEARFPRHIMNTKVYLKDFSEHLKSMLDDSNYKFSEEYERVTEIGLEHAKEGSLMAENRAKNRYTNILAYDHSRVKLSFVDDEPGSDYINASYIPGHRMRRAYVATQGPLPATFDDFWRMVWEQNTHVIVMLTQLVERGRTKCHRYWPGTEPSVYGDIAVEMISEKEKEDWTIREFRLSVPDSRTRLVRHYQFTSWPDHGVPDSPMAAIDFVRTVRSQVELHHGPMVVHCSAGVGRTGCFIALDTLQQHVRDHDWVDIYGMACEMRQHRNHMIQTEAQYVFIHKSMQEVIDSMARYGPGAGMGTGIGTHFKSGYSSVYCNPFAEEPSTTQMSDYYNDYLSEETHM